MKCEKKGCNSYNTYHGVWLTAVHVQLCCKHLRQLDIDLGNFINCYKEICLQLSRKTDTPERLQAERTIWVNLPKMVKQYEEWIDKEGPIDWGDTI